MKRFYEQIIDSLTSGVIAFDKNHNIVVRNRAACNHLCVQPDTLCEGMKAENLNLPKPFLDVICQVLAEQRPLARQEIVLTLPDGSKREIGLSASLLEGEELFNGAVFLFVDMTERRKLERAAELNRQLAQIGGLTAGVVHELRNPLSVIGGMAEILQRRFTEGEPNRRCADAIVREARQMDQSIAQFLGFAKPFELDTCPCRTESIVQRALELCRGAATKKEVAISITPNSENIALQADPARMSQAIANLISNAIDEVPTKTGWVHLAVSQDHGNALFKVFDNGPGIHIGPDEDLFNPFFTKKESGTGLGLAICHRIITAHGGSIAYSNLPEGGACFIIRIPQEKGILRG